MTLGAWEACRAIGQHLGVAFAIDTNPWATRVYGENFPEAGVTTGNIEDHLDGDLGDGTTHAERALVRRVGTVDLLVGGPPCQGHSDLNNHTRRSDPKNALYDRMARFAQLVQPKHILVENVPAALHDRTRVVERTAGALARLGYQIDQAVADVSMIGVAQKRRRHVLVASRERRIELKKVLSDYERKTRTVAWAISDLMNLRDGREIDAASSPTKVNRRRIDYLFRHKCYELPDSMRPDCHKLNEHTYRSVYGRMRWNEPAQTITSGFSCIGQGRFVHPKAKRTITPHEAARLQFIPDFFRFDESLPRTALAELIGNAVPPKLTYVLVLELLR